MARDYANYTAKKKNKTKAKPKKHWLFFIIILLALIVTFVRIMRHKPAPKKITVTKVEKIVQPDTKLKNDVHFDFYTILPQEQVDVSQLSSASKKNKERFVIQIAAVKDDDDAKHLQSELILLGLDVYIDKIKHKGELWNRVNIGPYFSKQAAVTDQEKLAENNIKGMLRKER